jgi:3-oxoacyl-[acyl-carrier protein] reductase
MSAVGRLAGSVAVVTGSTRGIGRGIAEQFALEGASVVVNSRDEAAAHEVAASIDGPAVGVGCDVATESGCDRLIARAIDAFGRIDVLVNNAGTTLRAPSVEIPRESWDGALALNLTAPFMCAQRAAKLMLDAGSGAIINISSIGALTTPPQVAAYVAAKAGLLALTKSLAAEWAPTIRVNAIIPGWIETELVRDLAAEGRVDVSRIRARTPFDRLGTTAEVARAAVFLASADASFVTGASLAVDGGWLVYGQNL